MTYKPDYFVRGADGKDYGADRSTIWTWIRNGQVTPEQLVYDSVADRWDRAEAHPDLAAAFAAARSTAGTYTAAPQPSAAPAAAPASIGPDYRARIFVALIFVFALCFISYTLWPVAAVAAVALFVVARVAVVQRKDFISSLVGGWSIRAQAILLVVVGVLLLTVSGFGVAGRVEESRAAARVEAEKEKAAQAEREKAMAHEAQLRRDTPQLATALQAAMQRIRDLDMRDSDDVERAHQTITEIAPRVNEYSKLKPLPAELQSPIASFREQQGVIEKSFSDVQAKRAIREDEKRASTLASKKDWIGADTALGQAAAKADKLSPQAKDAMVAEVTQARRKIKPSVERARLKEKQQQFYQALCGPEPTVSAWDGGIYQIKNALKENANDPDSIEVKDCTQPYLDAKRCWVTRCGVRGKNVFGGLVFSRRWYSISKLGIEEINR